MFVFFLFQAEDTRVQKAIEQIIVEHSDILNRKTEGTCFVEFQLAFVNFYESPEVFAWALQDFCYSLSSHPHLATLRW